jgi:Flavin containing amine oxidoreductase
MVSFSHVSVLACLSLVSLSEAASVRGSDLPGKSFSIRRRAQGGDMNNMNQEEQNEELENEDDDLAFVDPFATTSTTTSTTTTSTTTATTAAPEIVDAPPGGTSGAPPGSLAAGDFAAPGGAGATGSSNQTSSQCATVVYTDVIIVGAGMAGISAAARLQEQDPMLEYLILESSDRVGGRVRSRDFGVPGNTWRVEDGANWIYGDLQDNPLLTLVEATAFNAPLNDFLAFSVYGSDVSFHKDVFASHVGQLLFPPTILLLTWLMPFLVPIPWYGCVHRDSPWIESCTMEKRKGL